MNPQWLECPCGAKIVHQGELRLVWPQKDENQLYILCPDDSCYLKEVGYILLRRGGNEVRLNRVIFYPAFSSWNLARLGRERGNSLLKQLAKELRKRRVSWEDLGRPRHPSDL